MNKWDRYSCYCICWDSSEENQGIFEIITSTDKTLKLKQVQKGFFDYLWLRKDLSIKYESNTAIWCFKKLSENSFRLYRRDCWMPFIFEKINTYLYHYLIFKYLQIKENLI